MSTTSLPLGLSPHLTYKANLRETRYGWLRLTPAYSVHLVAEILDGCRGKDVHVLDPFCGTGTTALVCAERGVSCDTTDINPFLLWLARAKTRDYTEADLQAFCSTADEVVSAMRSVDPSIPWRPPLHQIEKWWDPATLAALGHGMALIHRREDEIGATAADLLKLAFCRTMIERGNVSFRHQSMSFRKNGGTDRSGTVHDEAQRHEVATAWCRAVASLSGAATSPIATPPRVVPCDARALLGKLDRERYSCVITSPPYPNRMSYIRELRPYMYWLGYLSDGRAAGEMDWQAIGGTWGCATGNLTRWHPEPDTAVPYPGFPELLKRIAATSPLLSTYVRKYFHDMLSHVAELFQVVRPGGEIHYIVGNSKFYDVLLPVQEIFAALFDSAGFRETTIRTIRKRTSKKELFEYVVSSRKKTRE